MHWTTFFDTISIRHNSLGTSEKDFPYGSKFVYTISTRRNSLDASEKLLFAGESFFDIISIRLNPIAGIGTSAKVCMTRRKFFGTISTSHSS